MRTIKCQICGKEVEKTNNNQKYCPECAKEKIAARKKRRYENNKEKVRAQHKEYYENNKEKERARGREYYENNKEKILAQKHELYENNKEHYKEYNKEYYENNKEKILAQQKEYQKNNYVYADREGNNFCVYIHTDPIGKVYVGRSFGEDVESVNKQRWQGGIGYQGQKFYDECIAIYGWDNIQHEIIEWNLTYEEVIEREQYWIERYNSRNPEYGYNVK